MKRIAIFIDDCWDYIAFWLVMIFVYMCIAIINLAEDIIEELRSNDVKN